MTTAFVTGGSGFIGGRLIERLRTDGHGVRALARSEEAAERITARGGEPVPGELGDRDALARGAEGCEWAFHAAAQLGDWGKREDFVRGHQGACRAARARGQSRELRDGCRPAEVRVGAR